MLLRNVVLFLVLSTSTTLFALDSNTTTNTIINEASKATQELQKAFEVELSEIPEVNTSKSKTSDINTSNIDVSNIDESKIDNSQIAISEITDSNTTVSKITTSIETNETQVIPNKLMNITLDSNDSENNHSSEGTVINATIVEQNIIETNTTESNLSHYPSPSLIDPLQVDQNLSLQEDPNLQEITVLEINQTNTTTPLELTVPIDQNNTGQNSIGQNSTKNISCEDNESNITQECQEEEVEGKMIRGLIIFKTRIKPFCDMTGQEFAKQYAQEDWDDIYHDKEFAQEVFKACPRVEKRYKTKWTPHLYEFTLEYASDSEAIPEC